MRKYCLLTFLLLFFSIAVSGGESSPLWLRYASISPDGTKIAFTYKGDIYTVATKGGVATQVTTNPAHDTNPVWSPDSKQIAFSSDREGGFDIFVVDARGGAPKRLTNNSASEYAIGYKDNNNVLFSAHIMPSAETSQFPSSRFPQTYIVDTDGGRTEQFTSLTMDEVSVSGDGKQILYLDFKGYEDKWRKHHVSSVTRDIWLYNEEDGSHTQLTTFKGENRTPVWDVDGKSFYYLSEENGSSNVYHKELNSPRAKQITTFENHPVRFLSKSKDNTLCYTYDGEIYTQKGNAKPSKVAVSIIRDEVEREERRINFSSGVNEVKLSPNGKEVAFIIRGDVFVASVEYGTTRRITDTPEQERNVSFSPDGRSVIYAGERDGIWNIYQTTIVDKEDKHFVYAKGFKEEQLTDSDSASFQPLYSPDGKKIAYFEDRTTLKVMDVKSKESVTVLDGEFKYSYADGDQWFEWSPDSKWLLTNYIGVGGWNNIDVALVPADGKGEVVNLTRSGYSDGGAKFVLDGKAMVWLSDRAGFRSHGSWGSHDDAYIMFFDRTAYDNFVMSKEESALYKEREEAKKKEEAKEKEKAKDSKKKKKKGDKKEEESKEVEPLEFELDNREDYILRLTPNSASIVDTYLDKKGEKLYYLANFEKGFDLWVYDIKERNAKILAKNVGASRIQVDSAEQNMLLLTWGSINKVSLSDGSTKGVSIRAEFDYKPSQEREYIFNHVWRQTKDKFYVVDMHGIDWEMYRDAYAKFLPHINNNYDFADILSELLGELNASHTGARYMASGSNTPTASLGAFFDESYEGDGLKVKEVVELGPLTITESKVKAGSIITKIDGESIKEGENYNNLLAGKAGKHVLITYKESPSSAEQELWVKAISNGGLSQLLYKRWVETNRAKVEELSDGRLGYIHVRGMDSPSFRVVYHELLGRYRNAEAVVIDTRHNGGGWLHDDLVTLLSGKEYQRFVPRGQYIGSDPFNKWNKPSIVLMSENNYSNAHGFPWLYKELGVGKLVGTSVPGTMTAVWWEQQIDGSIVFGIPQVAIKDMRGEYLENQDLLPDVEVKNAPESVLKGGDSQLEKAVEIMLQSLD